MKRKHQIARIKPGRYNYRAYMVQKFGGGWAIEGEDEFAYGPFRKTIKAVCRDIDRLYRRMEKEAMG